VRRHIPLVEGIGTKHLERKIGAVAFAASRNVVVKRIRAVHDTGPVRELIASDDAPHPAAPGELIDIAGRNDEVLNTTRQGRKMTPDLIRFSFGLVATQLDQNVSDEVLDPLGGVLNANRLLDPCGQIDMFIRGSTYLGIGMEAGGHKRIVDAIHASIDPVDAVADGVLVTKLAQLPGKRVYSGL